MGEEGALGIGEMGNDDMGNGDMGNGYVGKGDVGNGEVGNGYVGNGHVDPNQYTVHVLMRRTVAYSRSSTQRTSFGVSTRWAKKN